MSSIFTIITVLIVLASILLIGAVLLQSGKGEGLASNFVAGNQTFGVRQTADLLEKVTWGLVAFILVVSIIATFAGNGQAGNADATLQEKAAPVAPVAPDFATLPLEQADADAEAPAAEAPVAEAPAAE